jgi:hypothetical protein
MIEATSDMSISKLADYFKIEENSHCFEYYLGKKRTDPAIERQERHNPDDKKKELGDDEYNERKWLYTWENHLKQALKSPSGAVSELLSNCLRPPVKMNRRQK